MYAIRSYYALYHGIARGSFHDLWIEEGTAEITQVMSSRVAWAPPTEATLASGGTAFGTPP